MILLVACAGSTPSTALPEPVASQCGKYAGVAPEALSLCVGRSVRALDDPRTMAAACATLGDAAGACRTEWVLAHGNDRRDAVTLAELCGDDADCAFLMIDQRPSGSVTEQISRCERFAGPYTESCVGHAGNRWATHGGGDPGTIPEKWAYVVGVQWGLARGPGSCPAAAPAEFARGCELGASGRGGGGDAPPQPGGPGH